MREAGASSLLIAPSLPSKVLKLGIEPNQNTSSSLNFSGKFAVLHILGVSLLLIRLRNGSFPVSPQKSNLPLFLWQFRQGKYWKALEHSN